MTQPNRLTDGGRIDRTSPVRFRFNGLTLDGYHGDTLAAALLANDVHLIARSFKYHRPRGIVSAGAEEPNALVQIGRGAARTDPNIRATQADLYEGMEAESQNCWPSVGLDVSAVNDVLNPLFAAGFYYKTFMWPASFWKGYEYVIRRAAGLGRSPREDDPDRYDQRYDFCDVLVAGAGPAGISAALAAARTGARVILCDEQSEPGGSLLSEPADGITLDGNPAADWVASAVAELASYDTVTILPRTTCFGYYQDNFLGLLERVTDHMAPANRPVAMPRQRLWKVRARRTVLATGAIERSMVFHGNDRPGVMLAASVRSYINRYAVLPGKRIVVFANNDGAYRTALDADRAGADVTVVDIRPRPRGALPNAARAAGIEIVAGHAVTETKGRTKLKRVAVMALSSDGSGVTGPGPRWIDTDILAVSGGWNPAVHLFSQARGTLGFDPEHDTFIPDRPGQGTASAGSCAGTWTLAGCLAEGHRAGAQGAIAAGIAAPAPPLSDPAVSDRLAGEITPMRTIWQLPNPRPAHRVRAFVDQQNDVTAKDLKLAIREGFSSVEHVKRYTTTGMGTDQGKIGNVTALGIVAEAMASTIPDVGVTTFRPPYTPVTLGAIAGRSVKALYDPVRTTPIHEWHAAKGAMFENVGQWKRAWYYPKPGETMDAAVKRECAAVRSSAGLLDATTLGKIDIQGRDAAEFLNRIYTNGWLKLGVGRARYGLMLGEDGMVKDDGVTTRLADDHFHMTTTTGGAATVLSWLEEWHQTEWPSLEVFLTSVTEQWAVMTLGGPKSRDILARLCPDIDLSAEAFPFMTVRYGHVAGVPARVFRISFTGELSFEINVPASYGLAVWTALMETGAEDGLTPYGTESMHVLRAEKGLIIVGQETDGTITPPDLGMDWISGKKAADYIGKRSLARTDTIRPDRKHLVGLLPTDRGLVLEEGAHIVASPDLPAPPVPMLGHVTSSYDSPNVGGSFALALIAGGRDMQGRTLYAVAPDGRTTIPVTVTSPVFVDPEGERQHA
ncbi:sarcosine oxidase subunit alpha family protein [Fodinicurvata sp. EGI_FJ10296]|uniref:sarcosine oxidase subunit alpha family protein n=1 Tax=Fodinicurvata sp. EGI_FJ10296 TaxID=3231908 RepID=UPI003456D608